MTLGRVVAALLPLAAIPGGAVVPASAQEAPAELPTIGLPENWQLWHQPAVTPTMELMDDLHQLLVIIMVAICVLVVALLLAVIRFHHRRHPEPSRTSHNTLLEVAWTVLPVVLLVIIAVPSFRLLYFMDRIEDPELTLKAIGYQWYWEYEYPDFEGVRFTSLMIPEEELRPGLPRLLATDTPVVLPVDTNIRLLVTASDVIHAWSIPAFGVKRDAIPGRLNETWMRIEVEGVYYGQCTEICGTGHAYMPIMVEAVSKERFAEWIAQMQAELADAPPADAAVQTAQAP